jgi:hypothetical protein
MAVKKSKKQRKVGRNAAFCLRYRNSRQLERNKLKKLLKHLKHFPADNCAVQAAKLCKVAL